MAAPETLTNGWYPGEVAVQKLLNVTSTTEKQCPNRAGLSSAHAQRVAECPLLGVGTLDRQGRPWTTVWGGQAGFAQAARQDVLAIHSLVDRDHDPVVRALLSGKTGGAEPKDGEAIVAAAAESGRLMSGMAIDLITRDRVKLGGEMVSFTLEGRQLRLEMSIFHTLGNCPKYVNSKEIRPHVAKPQLVSSSLPLPAEALALIDKADLFFISSCNGHKMDTNHRGGPAGLVRVVSNSGAEGGVVVAYPEFSGNRLYQSLGNLFTHPRTGLTIPDFDTADVLYMTGESEILFGPDAAALLPRTKLALRIVIREARFVRGGLPFVGIRGEPSPYNPPLRKLLAENPTGASMAGEIALLGTVSLVGRQPLTGRITRYTFKLHTQKPVKAWRSGQYVTLDFHRELDQGYKHMNNADPQSLNDDFIRTFTISSPAPFEPGEQEVADGTEFQIVARRNGPVTGFLAGFDHPAAQLDIPVVGFGGEEAYRMAPPADPEAGRVVFIAGGVGITPVLAQAPGILKSKPNAGLRLLWALRFEDLPLAVDTLEQIPGLGPRTRIFVTRADGVKDGDGAPALERVRELGGQVAVRRLSKMDVDEVGVEGGTGPVKFYLCAGVEMQKALLGWLNGKDVIAESFNY